MFTSATRIVVCEVATTAITELVARALAEDIGGGDVTTAATVPKGARARAQVWQKAPGVVFGLEVAEEAFRSLERWCDDRAADR